MDDKGHPHRHVAFAAVAVGTFMSTLDASVVNVALPTLADEFAAGLGLVEWVVLAYLLALAGLLLNAGRISDLVGRGRVYAVGLGIFALASAACAAATSLPFLVGARVVQGIGGAMMNAAGPAILIEVFPLSQRGRVLGWVGLAVSAGLAAGPAIGGFVIDALSWRWIFLPNVPLAVLAAVVVLRAVPGRGSSGTKRFDVAGSVLLAFCLGALTLALSLGGREGFLAPAVLGLGLAALVCGIAFVQVERRHPAPVIDLSLFRNRVFTGSALAGLLVFITVGAVNLVMPFYLTQAQGLDTRQMGLVLTALPVTLALVSPISGAAVDRSGSTRWIATTGALLAAGALLVLGLVAERTGPLGIAACLGGIGLAVGTFQSPNNTALMGSVPADRLGTAGGLLATVRVTGMLVGNAIGAAAFVAAGAEPANGAGAAHGMQIAALLGAGAGLLAAAASLARGPAGVPRSSPQR
ncbi:DHA2 family efflux MFS transporter permease subunit [Vulgatibacter sp.]|uniref:DHA2 family efflux MFS transporter permease subunit n=1 Tax=Vulgatibacter sp. TaxID=1971226 RepID=UPI00356A4598